MNRKKYGIAAILPLCLVTFIPLIMMGHAFETNLYKFEWYPFKQATDYFLFYKMCAVIMIAAIMLFNIVSHIWKGKELPELSRKEWVQWGLFFGYIILVIISTVMSKYSYFGYRGIVDQFEPIWVVIGYGIIAFYAYNVMRDENAANLVMKCVVVSSGIEGLIGALQAFGLDIMRTDFVATIMSAFIDGKMVVGLEKGISYGTLYNPNYMGLYVILMLPVLVAFFMHTKDIIWRTLDAVAIVLLIVSLFGSGSKTGLIIIVFEFILFVALCFRYMLRDKKRVLPVVAIMALVVVGAIMWKGQRIVSVVSNSMHETTKRSLCCDFETGEEIRFTYMGHEVHIQLDEYADSKLDAIVVFDEEGKQYKTEYYKEKVFVRIEGSQYIFATPIEYVEGLSGVLVEAGENDYSFVKVDKKYKYYLTENKYVSLPAKEAKMNPFFAKRNKFASGRGFIWSRTIPLMLENIFIGTGKDTFTIAYPNDEYIALNESGYARQVITKPHNIFMQIGVESGMISLILFVAGSVWVSLTGIIRTIQGKSSVLHIGVLFSVLGYLFMGTMNDSFVGVSVEFWFLLGVLICMNGLAKAKENEEK